MEPSLVQSWPIAWQIVIFILGLVVGVFFLVKFCDIFVDGSVALAKRLKISPLIIGLTIVAIGTSCPELAVSVSDSISCLINGGNANVAIGNVVGSNICNLLIVLGFSAVFTPIIVKKSICKREYPFLLIITAVTIFFGLLFGLHSVTGDYAIVRWEGIVLCVLCVIYILFLIYNAKKHPEDIDLEEEKEQTTNEDVKEEKPMPIWKMLLFIVLGAAGVVAGGELVVFGAKGLALTISDAAGLNHDLAESLVGLTIVAVGTSLPELVTSVIAAKKGQNEVALGNVIGSNIFNVLFVLGISATINPLTTGSQIVVDLIVMGVATVVVYVIALFGKINRKHGILLLGLYACYLAYLITRTLIG